jgi:ABC-type amino acid transport substrate-binding protein
VLLFMFIKGRRKRAVLGLIAAGAAGAAGVGISTAGTVASAAVAHSATAADPGLMTPGTLVVGMDLQFKPEMYLKNGKPAGYDVDLLHKLATAMGVKLQIDNLAFTGLIPGLQTKKFDMVSVGLSNTPARAKVVSFTKAYVPYALVVGVPKADVNSVTSTASLNKPGEVITALLGSTDETLAQQVFPKAKITALADENSDFSLVATGRANAIVVEDYLLAQYEAANPGKLAEAKLKPLNVQYGSYAVQHGNTTLIKYLNSFLCTSDKNGTLASLYEKDFGVKAFPGVTAC